MNSAPTPLLPSLLRDRWIQGALLAACALGLVVALLSSGARNGDTVEHLERAADLARDLELGGDASRSPLLASLLAAARLALDAIGWRGALGLRVLGECFAAACSAIALLGGAALAHAYGGRRAARIAAWIIASSPVFAAWGAEVTSAPLATAALLWGAAGLARATSSRGALAAGAALGLAIAAKYQVVFLAPLLLLLPAATGAGVRGRRALAAAAMTFGALAIAGLADAYAYRAPWSTSVAYLRANALPPLYAILHPLLPDDARLAVHAALFEVEAGPAIQEGLPLARRKPLDWYFTELPAWLPLPWVALWFAGGLAWFAGARCAGARAERRAFAALGVALALHLTALALKGEKELRLLFALVPLLAAAFSLPIAALARSSRGRRALALCGLASVAWPWLQLRGVLPAGELGALDRHGAYAAAMRELARTARWPGDPPARVAALAHFAIALEERPGLAVERAPIPLDSVERAGAREREVLRGYFAARAHVLFRPTNGTLASERQSAQDAASAQGGAPADLRVVRAPDGAPAFGWEREPRALASLARELRGRGFELLELGDARPHYLLGHAPGFREQPALLRLLNESYVLSAALAGPRSEENLDELWVLARADLAPGGWPFARRHDRARHETLRRELSQPVDLLFVDAEGRPVLELVGVEIEPRWARDGFALSRWIWRASRDLAEGEVARTARRATVSHEARQVDGPIGGGLFDVAPWPALELREDLVLLPLLGLLAERSSGAFALWIALFDGRGVALSPLDRSRFPRSADGFVRVGGGVAERFSDRSFPRRSDAAGR